MGYGVSWFYGLWVRNPRLPSWWTKKVMGYKGLWLIPPMGYEGFDCNMHGACFPAFPAVLAVASISN